MISIKDVVVVTSYCIQPEGHDKSYSVLATRAFPIYTFTTLWRHSPLPHFILPVHHPPPALTYRGSSFWLTPPFLSLPLAILSPGSTLSISRDLTSRRKMAWVVAIQRWTSGFSFHSNLTSFFNKADYGRVFLDKTPVNVGES